MYVTLAACITVVIFILPLSVHLLCIWVAVGSLLSLMLMYLSLYIVLGMSLLIRLMPNDMLQGLHRSRIQCGTCSHISLTFEAFSVVSLSFPGSNKVTLRVSMYSYIFVCEYNFFWSWKSCGLDNDKWSDSTIGIHTYLIGWYCLLRCEIPNGYEGSGPVCCSLIVFHHQRHYSTLTHNANHWLYVAHVVKSIYCTVLY